jgi:hypothetical protein
MKRKWLAIGISIIAVVLLVLGSLSNVVGYQSVKSTMNDSPLFKTRAQRATNQQQNILTSQYLGKGVNTIQFPLRDIQTEQIQKIIEIIQKMDDNEFNRLQNLILSRFYEKKNNIDIDATQLITFLKQIKSSTKSLKIILNNNGNNTHTDPPTLLTAWEGCCNSFYATPPCIILWIIVILLIPFFLIFQFLTLGIDCSPEI